MIGSFSLRLAIVFVALAIGVQQASGQSPPNRRASQNAMRDLVRQLTEEAQTAMREEFLRQREPDAAERFRDAILDEHIQEAIVERQHREPFIDAYIRWQLTSFEITLPELSSQEFASFMERLPAMVKNPRGKDEAITLFEKVADAGSISPADLTRLREVNRELDRLTEVAEQMNAPALGFRAWVAEQLGETGPRRLLWLLENCAATIQGAWSTANVKRAISQAFSASASDSSISADERAAIARQAERMAGLRRRFINQVTFMADESVRVTFSNAAVANRDVENWIERLAGER